MPTKITHDQKEQALAGMRLLGTKKAGALAANISIEKLNEAIKMSAVFSKRTNEALREGKANLGDDKLQLINDVADGKIEVKMPRLTAALAIANWSIDGFRGKQEIKGNIQHYLHVKTSIPRPKYDVQIEGKEVKRLKEKNDE